MAVGGGATAAECGDALVPLDGAAAASGHAKLHAREQLHPGYLCASAVKAAPRLAPQVEGVTAGCWNPWSRCSRFCSPFQPVGCVASAFGALRKMKSAFGFSMSETTKPDRPLARSAGRPQMRLKSQCPIVPWRNRENGKERRAGS
jgi:hypothetical protein